jgi:GNAT superfamily N-acetyltransferase
VTIRIRPAIRADLPRIWQIRHGVAENRLTDPSVVKDDEVLWYMDQGLFPVSEDETGTGEVGVQGFGCGNPLTGYVWALFVDSMAQGRGHGSALLAWLEDRFRAAGLAQAHLTTGAETRAVGFYARCGWRRTGLAFSGEAVFVKVIRP